MQLKLSLIRLDGGTQSRESLNPEWIKKYAEDYLAGVPFDPIEVIFDGTNYWCWDGFHRCAASRQAKSETIEAHINQGTLDDAQWLSLSANKKHGLPRNNRDKAQAVRAAITHLKGAGLSDHQIAEHVGVSQPFVSKIRQQLTVTENGFQSPKRTGRDGRTINITNISKSNQNKPARPRSPTEIRDARKAGRKVRPVCLVKLQLPNNHVQNCAYDLLRHFTFEYLEKVFAHVVKLHQTLKAKETQS